MRREWAYILPKHIKMSIRTRKPLDCAPVCPPAMQKISEGIAAGMGLTLAEALLKGYTHTEATGLRSCVASRHAENLWGHAAESVLPPGSAKSYTQKGGEPLPRGMRRE